MQVLECLCGKILEPGFNAVFYIGDDDLIEYKTSADAYLLQIANFIGLPVIVWMADKSGAIPVSEAINFFHYIVTITR
jgi:hypothetical protein